MSSRLGIVTKRMERKLGIRAEDAKEDKDLELEEILNPQESQEETPEEKQENNQVEGNLFSFIKTVVHTQLNF